MAIDMKTMDIGFQGRPFVSVPAKDSIDTKTMDIGFQGKPFVCNYGTGATGGPGTTSTVLAIAGVAIASVSAIAGVAIASVGYVAGVDNIV